MRYRLTPSLLLTASLSMSPLLLAKDKSFIAEERPHSRATPSTPRASAPSAFDGARLLMQSQGQLNSDVVQQIFGAGVEANMRIPPEHLGVAFYDRRTGGRLDPQEIREEMGPMRQDGAHEVFSMAEQLLGQAGSSLPLSQPQLHQLMDAAFIASMRNPPAHIDIEYYDLREGPAGRGGGISGRVPEPRSPAAQREASARPPASSKRSQDDYGGKDKRF
ncbi:hypothetical protein [Marinospirillum sp.]|uniref:hypothetical protein n=1 Tax=Marinospirillum sp. TaxID=2183934 RepID=UPI003A85B88C